MNSPQQSRNALQTVDNLLTLTMMGASLASQLAGVNNLLVTVHQEGRQPTDEEVQAARDAYEEARTRVLANADRIEAEDRASAGLDTPG